MQFEHMTYLPLHVLLTRSRQCRSFILTSLKRPPKIYTLSPVTSAVWAARGDGFGPCVSGHTHLLVSEGEHDSSEEVRLYEVHISTPF